MLREVIKQINMYLISESQHYAINTLMNIRYTIQKKLEPMLGQYGARECALRIVLLIETQVKTIQHQFTRYNI